MQNNEMLKKMYGVLDKKLGEDIVILDVKGKSSVADYFVIVSAGSERQVKSLVDAVEDELAKDEIFPKSVEGKETAKWILVDYVDIVLHVFKTEDREFYNLERLWKDGIFVDVSNL